MFEIFLGFIALVYLIDIIALFYFGVHCYVMVKLYLENRKECQSDPETLQMLTGKMKKWPKVTVQLPMYNEMYVAERLIDAVAKIDYPKDLLEIQVLDDSTDETQLIAEKKTKEYQKKGFNIQYIHRTNRDGHKAGALKAAMKKATGNYIAIFDADFIPSIDFLRKTIPYFYESKDIGMVQTRWGHINADYSILTKAQSIGIDGHFSIEQVARAGGNLWLNFNGTAGVWRKSCILDAGNWESDTLTEDFDLSYRAELKGWKFKYLADVVNPAELPATVAAYKSQQFRWCKGSIQTAVKLIPRILKADVSWKIKLEAITHLTNYSVHPLMIINILATLPLLYFQEEFTQLSLPAIFAFAVFLSIGTFGPMTMYMVSQKSLYKDWVRRAIWLPILTMIGTGIAVNNTKAWLEAVMGKKSAFVRTPKLKLETRGDKMEERSAYGQVKLDTLVFWELALVAYILVTISMAISTGKTFVVPYMLLYAGGFLYVATASIWSTMKQYIAIRRAAVTKTDF
ncbi:MAG: glycosyltransferase family 2 protein [Leptospiraceae bacterium]|nr:glycosyltransferase family 2 protein [Leptospiraceae bacterium]